MCRYETESAAFEALEYLPTFKPLADAQELNVQPESVVSEITEMHMEACWGFAKRHLNNPQMARRETLWSDETHIEHSGHSC